MPLYSNAAGTIPIVQALLGKGLPLGSALAFMMAITAICLPEFIILRRVMKPRLLAVFVAIVAAGILVIGYLFNFLIASIAAERRSHTMKKIEVLGPGCNNCRALEANAREAVAHGRRRGRDRPGHRLRARSWPRCHEHARAWSSTARS